MDPVNDVENPEADATPADNGEADNGEADKRAVGNTRLTHLRHDGTAQMVDVSNKAQSTREATATATVRSTAEVLSLLGGGELPKGDALAVARIAGIMAAKKTPDLIPLCHPLPIAKVTIDFELDTDAVTIFATVKTRGVTGVEMEALAAASIAALTLYDMCKGVDRSMQIDWVRLLRKAGGRSGLYQLEQTP